jgi:hypothetical protein
VEKKKRKMTMGFMKSETINSMGISLFDKPMALKALITLNKHASIKHQKELPKVCTYIF